MPVLTPAEKLMIASTSYRAGMPVPFPDVVGESDGNAVMLRTCHRLNEFTTFWTQHGVRLEDDRDLPDTQLFAHQWHNVNDACKERNGRVWRLLQGPRPKRPVSTLKG